MMGSTRPPCRPPCRPYLDALPSPLFMPLGLQCRSGRGKACDAPPPTLPIQRPLPFLRSCTRNLQRRPSRGKARDGARLDRSTRPTGVGAVWGLNGF